jgi:hypothetical protein
MKPGPTIAGPRGRSPYLRPYGARCRPSAVINTLKIGHDIHEAVLNMQKHIFRTAACKSLGLGAHRADEVADLPEDLWSMK